MPVGIAYIWQDTQRLMNTQIGTKMISETRERYGWMDKWINGEVVKASIYTFAILSIEDLK